MTESHFKQLALKALILVACLLFWIVLISNAIGATVWNAAPGKYHKYDITPKNLTDSSYKYILTTDFEAVNSTWTKLSGTYIKYTTVSGGVKYAEEVIVAQPPSASCSAFACNDDFGWTFDLTKNTVMTCPMVKITNGVAQTYDGLQAGQTKCRQMTRLK